MLRELSPLAGQLPEAIIMSAKAVISFAPGCLPNKGGAGRGRGLRGRNTDPEM